MCDAQVASLRSRLERRVNRVPLKLRKVKLSAFIEASNHTSTEFATRPAQIQKPVPAPVIRKTRPAPAPMPKPSAKPAPKTATATTIKSISVEAPRPVMKFSRGAKRSSNEISTDDKENTNSEELHVPKKRAKATAPPAPAPATTAARPTRSTRAASKKVPPTTQVLSPKTNNARPAPQTRTRRQR